MYDICVHLKHKAAMDKLYNKEVSEKIGQLSKRGTRIQPTWPELHTHAIGGYL
jgi:hypothetical protein